jgi:transcriptional regulator with XRE-family HTH domain
MSELKQLLSRRVIYLRQRAGMTQEELAQAAGVGLDAIGRLERGQVTPSVDTLQAIAQVFQLDLSEFFRFEGMRAPNPVLDELDELAGFLATKPLDDICFYSQLIRDAASHLDKVRRISAAL